MKNRILKIYLTVFVFIIFLTSAFYIYEQINKINLPKGIISTIVNYSYFLIHLSSFAAMLYYGKELFASTNKKD